MKFGLKRAALLLCALLVLGVSAQAATSRQMEKLSRGLVAANVGNGMLVSWRLLGTDAPQTAFALYRDGKKIVDILGRQGTNYLDKEGKATSKYTVAAVVDSSEGEKAGLSFVFDSTVASHGISFPYKVLKLNVPKGGKVLDYVDYSRWPDDVPKPDPDAPPDSEEYSYVSSDASVADLDGDGEYEIVLKWDPTNTKDNSQEGFTGLVFIDAYKMDGKQMWRINMGKNIRAGQHYTQFQVYDYDGDGKAEIIMKTADGTIDGTGKVIGDSSKNYIDTAGRVAGRAMSGPEFLTVFRGSDGAEITTIDYLPSRSIQEMLWVDSTGREGRWGDDYGNRSDRFIAATAYLDGVHPSAIFARGYYTSSYVAAYDFDGKDLKLRWLHKSETPGEGLYAQGNHNIATGDIDGDGYDEIVFGGAALKYDGSVLYSTGFGHGDAGHIGDFDPDIPGLEYWGVHETTDSTITPYTDELRDSKGNVIWGTAQWGRDNGRGLAADIDSSHRGYEMWSSKGDSSIHNVKGKVLGPSKDIGLSINFRTYFDGDLQDELLDGAVVTKYNIKTHKVDTLFDGETALGLVGCNGTKNTPNLMADIFGDWREEIILRSEEDPSKIYIVATPKATSYRVYTLMHDAVYRMGVAWQNTAYNQPPYLSYYLPDMVKSLSQPVIYTIDTAGVIEGIEPPADTVDPGTTYMVSGKLPPSVSFNPWNGVLHTNSAGFVEVSVFSVRGGKVARVAMYAPAGSTHLSVADMLPKGMYYARVKFNGREVSTSAFSKVK